MNKLQLFLLHFAGGNCYSFQFLQPCFPNYEFIPLELPGRGRRMGEHLLTNFEEAAEDLFSQVLRQVKGPFIIYGHSMGAILGLKITHMLEKIHKAPLHLVVSGNPGPAIKDNMQRHLLGKDEFIAELKRLGGMPVEFFENEDLLNFFEPILRADFEINESNDFESLPPVQTPIYAIMGNKEMKVEYITNWQQYTLSGFTGEVLTGDHFFIYNNAERIASIIHACYDKTVVCRY